MCLLIFVGTVTKYTKSALLFADSWRSRSAAEGLRNGDAGNSTLGAKGFRSVKPNLQDKKSPTAVHLSLLWFLNLFE